MIEWQEAYSTGVEALDEQHKYLFNFCNDIQVVLQEEDVTRGKLVAALKFLEEYATKHFGQEETCMHKFACPIAGKNQMAHQEFILSYKNFERRISQEDDSYALLKELHTFLEEWLVEHICNIDTQLKPCVHH